MEIQGLLTKNGGKVHVHFGKECITNLWNSYYVITDLTVIGALKKAVKSASPSAAMGWILSQYSDPSKIGRPYIRSINAQAARPAQSAPQVVADDFGTEPAPIKDQSPPPPPTEKEIAEYRVSACEQLRRFFSEFAFRPAARFVNSIAKFSTNNEVTDFITGYVKLIANPDATAIIEKMKSLEFEQVSEALRKYPPEKAINSRLNIYFGDAGTGKTTLAMQEYPDAPIVPCNASVLPDELLRTFDFNDANGNPVFKHSTLRKCMENGKPIIFDEINLLSFDCLRLLQTLTDNKEVINYNGETINIKPGFKIIGTMNLTVNEQVYSLPEPLVDRANVIKEFTLSNEDLAAYAFA